MAGFDVMRIFHVDEARDCEGMRKRYAKSMKRHTTRLTSQMTWIGQRKY